MRKCNESKFYVVLIVLRKYLREQLGFSSLASSQSGTPLQNLCIPIQRPLKHWNSFFLHAGTTEHVVASIVVAVMILRILKAKYINKYFPSIKRDYYYLDFDQSIISPPDINLSPQWRWKFSQARWNIECDIMLQS